MLLDLDDFKIVNDTLGHHVGDQLLVKTARRLAASLRATDTVARLGGDEFLILLPELTKSGPVEMLAEKVLDCFRRPFNLEGNEIYLSGSLGITLAPADGGDPHFLLRNADSAMYRAKDLGGGYQFFTPEMNSRAKRRFEIQSGLRVAHDKGQLKIHYQPIVDPQSATTVGGEALLRWTDPDLGPISPGQFIPVAEETGLIVPIGEWLLENVCRKAVEWQAQARVPLEVSVNISSRQFQGTDLVKTVRTALDESGLQPELLALEVTEGLLLRDAPATGAILAELSGMGVQLSIDDFGTGYSSLSYLKRFPFNILKVDRSFVRDVVSDPGDATLVNAIIAMARSLGLKVVGEGVETEEQLRFLASRECDVVQGFYYSPAVPPDAFMKLLTEGTPQLSPVISRDRQDSDSAVVDSAA
jgi:diguanylate cyclase (GGDEF)-like protein